MTITKKLSWAQLIIMFVSFVVTIIFFVKMLGKADDLLDGTLTEQELDKFSFSAMFTFSSIYSVLFMIMAIASFVLGILQIVNGSQNHDANGKGVAAGILGLLSLIPLVGIAALVMNIIVVSSRE